MAALIPVIGVPRDAATPAPPPPVGTLAEHPGWPASRRPGDADTIKHLMAALYDVISGPAGKPRGWLRFLALFLPEGRLGAIRPEKPAANGAPAKEGHVIFHRACPRPHLECQHHVGRGAARADAAGEISQAVIAGFDGDSRKQAVLFREKDQKAFTRADAEFSG